MYCTCPACREVWYDEIGVWFETMENIRRFIVGEEE